MRGSQDVLVRTPAIRALAPLALVALVLSGCSAGSPAPSESPSAAASSGTATPAAAPVLHPDGSAEENLPLFAAVVARVWAGESRVKGGAYIDALTAAGFTRADMQVTADESTVGNPAESIQFSVRWGQDQCLVGQVGPSTGDPVTSVLPQVDGGRCLIGKTVPIQP
ncbi:MAG: hypothetical protein LBE60_01345 [Microbacterium sp.]|uniref:DUF6993 domain-containing protein n=1 Tax=Microbacterium sp. TaxID=51671 RepID=UPI00283122C1|nr:hypothetical protein [Microbacterium sp.]MDR2320275.1 hypothetical protein [Microbacterium sp.]